jgi:trigger factor
MKYTIKKLPKSKIEILFEIPFEEMEKFRKEAVLELTKLVKVEGFRPGKAPEKMVEGQIGEMKIMEEAAEHAINENYKKAVLESKIIPISQPQVEILKLAPGNLFEFKVSVDIMPEVKIPDYKKIASESKRGEVSVDEKELEDSLLWLQKSRAKMSLKPEPAKKGDFVEIEYNSPQLDSGKAYKDGFVLGEGHFFKGFEENLEGMKESEEKEFPLEFPKDYAQKNLAGKTINFKVKVKSVQKMELPELNDEFAKGLGKFNDLAALKENMKKGLTVEKQKAESDRIRSEILEKITAAAVCDIPDVLIEDEKARILLETKDRVLQGLGISFEEYLKQTNKTEKDLLDSFSEQAQKRVKGSIVLREIGGKENVVASEEEINEEVDSFFKKYPDMKSAGKEFDQERLREYTEDVIQNEKIFKLLETFVKNI